MNDFTVAKYRELLEAISESGLRVYTLRDWHQKAPQTGILIRHDVDRKPLNSLVLARMEHEFGFSTTYNFRITPNSFVPKFIRQISALGHEIGYHYEDLSLAGGDFARAKKMFTEHLARLRKLAPVSTATMHGRPFSPYDNRDLWKEFSLEEFELEAEAYRSIDYRDTYYITDTGRSWAENAPNVRDKAMNSLRADVETTDDLIRFVTTNSDSKIAIVNHPERWSNDQVEWWMQHAKDQVINLGKIGYGSIRTRFNG